MDRGGRHPHRARLRRGALADARGVDARPGGARDVREAIPRPGADPGRAGAADEPREGVRQGPRRAAPDGVLAHLAVVLRPRSGRGGHRPDDSRVHREVPAVRFRRRHALPDRLRPSRRVLGGLLHLPVVAGDREGHVQPVRRDEPVRAEDRAARTARRCSPPADPLPRRSWWRTSSDARSASPRTRRGSMPSRSSGPTATQSNHPEGPSVDLPGDSFTGWFEVYEQPSTYSTCGSWPTR